ncbi:MAG: FG-GAP repeat protein [Segetibacter sp.]
MPAETISGSCVCAADIDKDGLADLFVGAKLKPGMFPEAPESFILKIKARGDIFFL